MSDKDHTDRPIMRAVILVGTATLTAIGYGAAGAWVLGTGLSEFAVILFASVGAASGACIAGAV